jgi:ATP-dependent RNA helicase DHX8/PRP22
MGVLAGADDDAEEEFEIDLNDQEPEFLKGHSSKSGIEMSPIKIVKNPEGSMQRAAMTQVGGVVSRILRVACGMCER